MEARCERAFTTSANEVGVDRVIGRLLRDMEKSS
jgi:hypothetical protein